MTERKTDRLTERKTQKERRTERKKGNKHWVLRYCSYVLSHRLSSSVAETQFVVAPLSHISRDEAMSPDVARVAHGGPAAEEEGLNC